MWRGISKARRDRRARRGRRGATGTQGPQGVQGVQGPAGVTVWADVAGDGTVIDGQGLAVQETSAGVYEVTVTDPVCSRETNAPVASVPDSAPGTLPTGDDFPVAWYGGTPANEQFTVYTGVVSSSSTVTPTSSTFDVLDTCG